MQRSSGLSLGIHFEHRSRLTSSGKRFGPYLDVHFPGVVLSFGRNPIYAGELDLLVSYSRGGLNANYH